MSLQVFVFFYKPQQERTVSHYMQSTANCVACWPPRGTSQAFGRCVLSVLGIFARSSRLDALRYDHPVPRLAHVRSAHPGRMARRAMKSAHLWVFNHYQTLSTPRQPPPCARSHARRCRSCRPVSGHAGGFTNSPEFINTGGKILSATCPVVHCNFRSTPERAYNPWLVYKSFGPKTRTRHVVRALRHTHSTEPAPAPAMPFLDEYTRGRQDSGTEAATCTQDARCQESI